MSNDLCKKNLNDWLCAKDENTGKFNIINALGEHVPEDNKTCELRRDVSLKSGTVDIIAKCGNIVFAVLTSNTEVDIFDVPQIYNHRLRLIELATEAGVETLEIIPVLVASGFLDLDCLDATHISDAIFLQCNMNFTFSRMFATFVDDEMAISDLFTKTD